MFHDSRSKYWNEGEKEKVFEKLTEKWMETYRCILNSRKVTAFAIGEYWS